MQERRKPHRGDGGASERFENRTFNSKQQLESSDFQTEKSRPPDNISLRTELSGDDTATALGITTRGSAPVLALCRQLIKAGHNPATPLEAWRGNILCFRVRSIGEAAQLEINGRGTGFKWRAAVGTASPMRQNEGVATPTGEPIASVQGAL